MNRRRRLLKPILLLVVSLAVSGAGAALFLDWKFANDFHRMLAQRRWPHGAYRINEATRNFEMSPTFFRKLRDGSFFLKTHELGYRVPKFLDARVFEPGGILAVGCSFTFGDGVEAEDTFTNIAAMTLGLQAYNYGVCSYSFASMVAQLEDLERRGVLEKLQPSVILIGAGDWLIARSLSPLYPTRTLQLAYPYISKHRGIVQITEPPDYISVRHAIDMGAESLYFGSDTTQDPLTLSRRLVLLDLIPRVLVAKAMTRLTTNELSSYELYSFVIERISQVAQRTRARLVVLEMPFDGADSKVDPGLVRAINDCSCATLVDGHGALVKHGATRAKRAHPSKLAHRTYARAIVEALTASSSEEPTAVDRGNAEEVPTDRSEGH
jgi:hypothetical protein